MENLWSRKFSTVMNSAERHTLGWCDLPLKILSFLSSAKYNTTCTDKDPVRVRPPLFKAGTSGITEGHFWHNLPFSWITQVWTL